MTVKEQLKDYGPAGQVLQKITITADRGGTHGFLV